MRTITSLLLLMIAHFIVCSSGRNNINDLFRNSVQEHPVECDRERFIYNIADKRKQLNESDFETFEKCTKYYPECSGFFGILSATYAMKKNGNDLFILFQILDSEREGCWGYYLEIQTDKEKMIKYFLIDGMSLKFLEILNVSLGVTYNFKVVSLPDGQSLTLTTETPNTCELQIIQQVTQRLEEEEDFFEDCPQPSYKERKEIANKLCKKYRKDRFQRWRVTKHQVVQENCKFVLLPQNFVNGQ